MRTMDKPSGRRKLGIALPNRIRRSAFTNSRRLKNVPYFPYVFESELGGVDADETPDGEDLIMYKINIIRDTKGS